MPTLKISDFDGEIPRRSDTMLEGSQSTATANVRLYSGELRAWRGPTETYEPSTADIKSIYLFKNTSTSETLWLTWDVDVDVQRSSLADDADFRVYYTGDGTPKKTNWDLADTGGGGDYPETYYEMGVPAPTTAPSVASNGTGTAPSADTRFYVYTFVSTFGGIEEESAPSPVSAEITIAAGESVDLSSLETTPAGDYNITALRIYRTVPGENTVGSYVFVAEISEGTTTYNDDQQADELGEALTTIGWTEPPDTMAGLTSMANGMMAGFVDNTVYFCEPYYHHAWPIAYAQSVPDKIVGLGSYGNTLIVMTTGQPYAMVGVTPDAIRVEKIPMPQPCASKTSITVDQYGVIYASPNGLVSIGPQGRGVITNELFRRKEWQEYSPESFVGSIYDGKYFATFESAIQGNRTMVISRDDRPALTFFDIRSRAFHADIEEGDLYYLETDANKVYKLDDDPLNPYTYEWTSKRFYMNHGTTWSVIKVDTDLVQQNANEDYNALVASIAAANQLVVGDILGSLNSYTLNEYPVSGSTLTELPSESALLDCAVFIFGEGEELKASLTIDTFDTRRIPPFRARAIKVKVTGTINVRSVQLATDFASLQGDAR